MIQGRLSPKKKDLNEENPELNIEPIVHIGVNNSTESTIQNEQKYKWANMKIGTSNAQDIFVDAVKEKIFLIGEEIDQWKVKLLNHHKSKGGNPNQNQAPNKAYDDFLELFERKMYVMRLRKKNGSLDQRGKITIIKSDFWGSVEKRENEVGEVVITKFDPLHTYGPDEVKNGVYLVYFESYKKIDSECKNFWRCKVGMTTEDLEKRYTNAKTFFPEKLVVHSFFKHSNQKLLENYFHSRLELMGRKLGKDLVYGEEWFYTNPDEVLSLYNDLNSGL